MTAENSARSKLTAPRFRRSRHRTLTESRNLRVDRHLGVLLRRQEELELVSWYLLASAFGDAAIGNEIVPIQLAGHLPISNAKMYIYFSNNIHGSNFLTQHSETV